MSRIRKFTKLVVTLSISVIIASGIYGVHVNIATNAVITDYSTEVSTENWEIKSHIVTSGDVSEETIEKVCEIIKNKVNKEAWNYLCNSGGKLIIVEGNDIKDYIIQNYNTDGKAEKVEKNIKGYCPYFYEHGVLQKVDVVVGSECLDSLTHEFYHAYDYSHNYSSSQEFQELYKNAENVCRKIYPDNEEAIEYYSTQSTEYFAEMASLYDDAQLTGVDPNLESYFAGILQ